MRTLDCDLLCVGGGLGGLAAAVRAHDLGLRVLVAEASAMVGGGVTYGGGLAWIPCTHLARKAGIEDSLPAVERYLDRFSKNHDAEMRRAWLRSGPAAIEWYTEEAGLPFELAPSPDDEADDPDGLIYGRFVTMTVPGATLGRWQSLTRTGGLFPPGVTMRELYEHAMRPDEVRRLVASRTRDDIRTLGAGVGAGFVRAALTVREIPIEIECRVVALTQSNGRVTGGSAVCRGEEIQIRAERGVLIACGSYGDADYAAAFERLPDLVQQIPPLGFGDNLTLTDPTPAAHLIGSPVVILPAYQVPGHHHPGTDAPLYRATPNLSWKHAIIVNRQGNRFGDEMFHGPELAAHVQIDPMTGDWVNFPSFLICDDRMRQESALSPFAAGDPWPEQLGRKADTLRELAELVGIAPIGLEHTVRRFNGFVAQGVDRDFGRGRIAMGNAFADDRLANPSLSDLREPPFWAIPVRLAGGGNYSLGIAIDRHARAVTRAGEPVPGLYATGNSAARTEVIRHHTGTTDSRNIIWSFNAASHAAGRPAAALAQ